MTLMTVTALLPALKTTPLVLEPARHARWPRCLLLPGRHRIGAGDENQVRIDVAGVAVDHAIIVVGTDRVILKAWDRRTWVNDGPVQECELRVGDRVTIGPCSWLVCSATTDDLLSGWPTPAAIRETPVAPVPPPPPLPEVAVTFPSEVEALSSPPSVPVLVCNFVPAAPVQPSTVQPSSVQPSTEWSSELETDAASAFDTEAEDLLRLQDELLQLRRELDEGRSTWRQETHRRELELATESAQLTRRGAALERADHDLQRSRQELESLRGSLAAREATLQKSEQQLTDLQQGLLAERQRLEVLSEATRNELQQETARQTAAWKEWEATQTRLLQDLAEQSGELEQRRHDLQLERSRLTEERIDFEHVQREFRQAQREFLAERDRWLAESQAWDTRQQARDEEHARFQELLQRQQDQLSADTRERARSQAEFLQAQQQLQHERRLFADQQTAWIQERESLWSELTEQRHRLDRESQHLESTQHKLDQLQVALEAELSSWKLAQAATENGTAESVTADIETPAATETVDASESATTSVDDVQTLMDPEIESTGDIAEEDVVEESLAELETESTTADFEAVQAALDALAARFEEFSDLEQRLSNKHDELRDLQEDLAVREAALNAQTSAWQQEHAEWQVEIAADRERREAWEISRQAEAAVMLAERRLWPSPVVSAAAPSVMEIAEPASAADTPDSAATVPTSVLADEFCMPAVSEPDLQPPPLPTELEVVETVSIPEPETAWHLPQEMAHADLLPESSETVAPQVEHFSIPTEPAWNQPAVDHRVSAPAASEDDDLRSRLAAMFGLPENFAQRAETEIDQTTDESAVAETWAPEPYSDPIHSTPLQETAEKSTRSATAADENWRDRLNELLVSQQSEPSTEMTPAAPKPNIQAEEQRQPALSIAQDDDSVSAYMERLLARTRRGEPDPQPAVMASVPETLVSATESANESVLNENRVDNPLQTFEPRKRLDTQATRLELQSFREVANLSARTALAKHSWETTKTEFLIQLGITGFSTVAAASYWSAPLFGRAIAWGPALGCTLAASFVGWRAYQSWLRFSLISPGHEASEFEDRENSASDLVETESPAASLETTGFSRPTDLLADDQGKSSEISGSEGDPTEL